MDEGSRDEENRRTGIGKLMKESVGVVVPCLSWKQISDLILLAFVPCVLLLFTNRAPYVGLTLIMVSRGLDRPINWSFLSSSRLADTHSGKAALQRTPFRDNNYYC